MRLQAGAAGLPKAERSARGDELLERVGLTDAADRKVGGYSGGMKRRLDLALALVHHPRILFLDEPTTGLDPSEPHRPVGRGRAARARGGRDRLPHHAVPRGGRRARRPRRDHRPRPIVAEGTPAALKAEIGRPTVEAVPADRADRAPSPRCSARFGAPGRRRRARPPCGWRRGEELADVVRALDAADLAVADLQLHEPTLDDVFLAKTGRKLEARRGRAPAARRGRARERCSRRSASSRGARSCRRCASRR